MRIDSTFKDPLILSPYSIQPEDHWLAGWLVYQYNQFRECRHHVHEYSAGDLLRVEAVSIKSQITSYSGSISSSELILSWSETLFV